MQNFDHIIKVLELGSISFHQIKRAVSYLPYYLKWPCKIGQSVKVYSDPMKEYRNDETTEVFRLV